MAKIFVTTLPDGKLAIIRLAAGQDEAWALAKTMFELTRPPSTTGRTEHFDPTNPDHRRGPPVTEMDDSLLPTDRTQRDRWEHVDGIIRVRPTP